MVVLVVWYDLSKSAHIGSLYLTSYPVILGLILYESLGDVMMWDIHYSILINTIFMRGEEKYKY